MAPGEPHASRRIPSFFRRISSDHCSGEGAHQNGDHRCGDRLTKLVRTGPAADEIPGETSGNRRATAYGAAPRGRNAPSSRPKIGVFRPEIAVRRPDQGAPRRSAHRRRCWGNGLWNGGNHGVQQRSGAGSSPVGGSRGKSREFPTSTLKLRSPFDRAPSDVLEQPPATIAEPICSPENPLQSPCQRRKKMNGDRLCLKTATITRCWPMAHEIDASPR